jgi:hypothetical protein
MFLKQTINQTISVAGYRNYIQFWNIQGQNLQSLNETVYPSIANTSVFWALTYYNKSLLFGGSSASNIVAIDPTSYTAIATYKLDNTNSNILCLEKTSMLIICKCKFLYIVIFRGMMPTIVRLFF